MNFRKLPNSLGQHWKSSKTSVQVWLSLGSLRKTSEIFFLFPAVKVKVIIASSKSIWGHGGRFDGQEVSPPFSSGGGGEVRYWGDMKDLKGLASLTAAEQNTFIFKLFFKLHVKIKQY